MSSRVLPITPDSYWAETFRRLLTTQLARNLQSFETGELPDRHHDGQTITNKMKKGSLIDGWGHRPLALQAITLHVDGSDPGDADSSISLADEQHFKRRAPSASPHQAWCPAFVAPQLKMVGHSEASRQRK
ncbi:hypothetical protein PT974_06272 [Cladobotryum mycophilum]|uniref:Uncharacterized protein n=1 Tax=Cladobotryum mycophilum TaxID=491253 RepID=A0ABR0SM76_9HYPO